MLAPLRCAVWRRPGPPPTVLALARAPPPQPLRRYSLAWWTVALQGLVVIGVFLLAFGIAAKFKPTVASFLLVNTAVLIGIAYTVVPLAANLNAIKVKGKYPDAVAATAAGLILALIFNFTYLITSALGESSN